MRFDLGIFNGRVVDGAGNPWYVGDIGVTGSSIAKIGRLNKKDCRRTIDASGHYVCPGFIDIHTHSDLTAMVFPGCDSTLRQGVTTHLVGNCGSSAAPLREPNVEVAKTYWGEWAGKFDDWDWRTFGDYLEQLERRGVGHNIAALVGHGAVRTAVLGAQRRAPNAKELEQMKGLVDEAMRSGAFGMSTGLVYPPGSFAKTNEIVELCKVVARYGGMYTSHIRGERETILDAIREAILIGQKSGVRVQISHNCPKIGAWGRTKETLELVEKARKRGLQVTVDNDVHTDLAPALSGALPQYLHELKRKDMIEHLRSPANRARIRKEIIEDKLPAFGPSGLLKHGYFDRIFLMHCPKLRKLEGKTVAQVAKMRKKDVFDTYFDLIVEEEDEIIAIFDYIREEDVRKLLVHPLVMVSSDCATWSETGPLTDPPPYVPCAFGEYPGIFERYVRDEPVLTMQEAVRKMTSYPAQTMGLFERGLLRPGMKADIAVIDLARIKDRATNLWPHKYPFENYPHKYPLGVPFVIVNGKVAVDNGRQTKVLAGEVLRHRPR
ncbi:MAG: D-aminoacylase [Thermoplasmata archaeon]|jgi:N-acyl-D-amino-acid deacylase|nr:D-aminoacylase [Thermoplasmata archaeon]